MYDLVAALCMTGYIWGYREGWAVNSNQLILTWILLWLLHHIHFVVLNTLTAFLPPPAIPFVLLTWIIINITASITHTRLTQGFTNGVMRCRLTRRTPCLPTSGPLEAFHNSTAHCPSYFLGGLLVYAPQPMAISIGATKHGTRIASSNNWRSRLHSSLGQLMIPIVKG